MALAPLGPRGLRGLPEQVAQLGRLDPPVVRGLPEALVQQVLQVNLEGLGRQGLAAPRGQLGPAV